MTKFNLQNWQRLMQSWGLAENRETFDRLETAYAESWRHYHTAEHIDACLRHVDRFDQALEQREEVEIALWFHDAVYKPFSSRNEAESADWAVEFLADNGVPESRQARVRELILVTQHDCPTQTKDQSILVDIDLAILGATPEVYEEFEHNVRREYRFVPGFIYRRKRAALLEDFLNRSRIYINEPFATERESQARTNLKHAISKLKS